MPQSCGCCSEIELVCATDTLVRAGASVTLAAGGPERFIARSTRPFVVQVTVASCSGNLKFVASRGLKIEADKLVSECAEDQWDAIVVPGVRAVVSGASPVRFTVGGCVQVGCQARRTSQRMPLQCQSCRDSTHSRSWSLRYARHL